MSDAMENRWLYVLEESIISDRGYIVDDIISSGKVTDEELKSTPSLFLRYFFYGLLREIEGMDKEPKVLLQYIVIFDMLIKEGYEALEQYNKIRTQLQLFIVLHAAQVDEKTTLKKVFDAIISKEDECYEDIKDIVKLKARKNPKAFNTLLDQLREQLEGFYDDMISFRNIILVDFPTLKSSHLVTPPPTYPVQLVDNSHPPIVTTPMNYVPEYEGHPHQVEVINRQIHKRKRRPWSAAEVNQLMMGVEKYGTANWSLIRDNCGFTEGPITRTNVDIKDKYRNIVKAKLRAQTQ